MNITVYLRNGSFLQSSISTRDWQIIKDKIVESEFISFTDPLCIIRTSEITHIIAEQPTE